MQTSYVNAPHRPNDYTGEGYGGGGGYDYGNDYGLPGAVILDFTPDE